jgi:nucleoside-diphosphate-sugar epimerase
LPNVLIAGCGFLGEAAAAFFSSKGWDVLGLTSSIESAASLAGRPFPVQPVDLTSASSLAALRAEAGAFDCVVHCASSGRGGPEAYRQVYVQGCTQLSAAFPDTRLIFTGSTSVYAQTDGEWVDEDSPTEPSRETGRLLLEAEDATLAAGGCVLRLAGLYGLGRSVLLRKFLDGSATIEDGGGRWINQICREDAARAIYQVALSGESATRYNVVDDEPATQHTVYGWIATHLNRPLPPEGPIDRDRKRGWTSKRVSNARLRSLGWSPEFPSYRVALPSIAASLGVGVGEGDS